MCWHTVPQGPHFCTPLLTHTQGPTLLHATHWAMPWTFLYSLHRDSYLVAGLLNVLCSTYAKTHTAHTPHTHPHPTHTRRAADSLRGCAILV